MKKLSILFCSLLGTSLIFAPLYSGDMDQSDLKVSSKTIGIGMTKAYATILTTIFAHEAGHWAVGKKLYACNGIFFITPFCDGTTIFYRGSTFNQFLKSLCNRDYKNAIDDSSMTGKKRIAVLAAGPLCGLAAAASIPLANTFYHEYKENNSLSAAMKKTIEKPYINEKQDFAITVGAVAAASGNFRNCLPFVECSDGARILKIIKPDITITKSMKFSARALGVAMFFGGFYKLFASLNIKVKFGKD